jgi:hypothetical protein
MNRLLSVEHRGVMRLIPALLVAACAFAVMQQPVYALYKPGDDNSELFVTGTASITENDNIFLSNNNKQSALIFDEVPGLSYVSGKDTSIEQTKISVSEDFQEYANGQSFTKQLTNAELFSRYDDDKMKLSFDGTFNQLDQPEVGLQNLGYLEERDVTNLVGTSEFQMTDKSSVGVGVTYFDTDYANSGFTNWSYIEVPVDYYWKVEPKLDLSAGFRYRDNTVGTGGIDSQNYYYNVGARGEFAPDLTGYFDIGYNQVSLKGQGTQNAMGADSKFVYTYSPKTTVTVSLNEDYGYSAIGGGGYRQPNAYVAVTTALTEQWLATGQVSYARYEYITTPQRDDFYAVQLGVAYIVNTNFSVKAAYNYAEDNSNIAVDSFKNNIFTLSASVRF